ncbi:MAG TPA: methyltransferase domain-containing protein [Bacilli bacterium]|nr:methyltransferase domain-containing protein [Bacilli bacterium]
MNIEEYIKTIFPIDIATPLIESLSKPAMHAALLNPRKMSDEHFLELFPSAKIHPLVPHAFIYDPLVYDLGKTIYHDAGAFYLQDPSAMSVANFFHYEPNDIVLDFAAAPGGKTIQAAMRLNDNGIVISNDIDGLRALTLSKNVERMGLGNVIVTNNDFQKTDFKDLLFDKVFLDAPCSGSGMLRKSQAMRDDWSLAKVLRFAEIQKKLIIRAFDLLKPGGKLLYSTCSFSYEENEAIVEHLLNQRSAIILPLTTEEYVYHSPKINEALYFLPAIFPGEGQFVACLQKPNESSESHFAPPECYSFFNYSLKGQLLKRNDGFYLLNPALEINKGFNVLRSGVKVAVAHGDHLLPDHHLAHYLGFENSINLTMEEMKKYRHGDTLHREIANGFHVVSYDHINLGWVKAVDGILKNHYPKGLRH